MYSLTQLISALLIVPSEIHPALITTIVEPPYMQEYSLPTQEVQVQNPSEEKSAVRTAAEVVPDKSAETPAADETTVAVKETSETPEVKEPSENPEAEDSSAAEESSEGTDEAADEKPEIKVWHFQLDMSSCIL